MRLLNTFSYRLEDFLHGDIPPYVILSHTWGRDEVVFQDLNGSDTAQLLDYRAGGRKIKYCCAQAREDGYDYAWIDTCCIDKTSSSELSEAINTMYKWYSNSDICYAYLSDVPTRYSVQDPNWGGIFDVKGHFRKSRWFTRGWTLQELIAPTFVEFYTADWQQIGSKESLRMEIAEITGIDHQALQDRNLSRYNVAEKMSWAASRETTRIEDEAYSLLGIFQVNMPLLYGEGRQSFFRLQAEILKGNEDYTIFTWGAGLDVATTLHSAVSERTGSRSLFATQVSAFGRPSTSLWRYSDIIPIPRHQFSVDYDSSLANLERDVSEDSPATVTGRGLRISLPMSTESSGSYMASMYCKLKSTEELVCISLTAVAPGENLFARKYSRSRGFHLISNGLLSTFRRRSIYVQNQDPGTSSLKLTSGNSLSQRFTTMITEGHRLMQRQDYLAAEEVFSRTVRLSERMMGPHHELAVYSKHCLYESLKAQGRIDDAEEINSEVIQTRMQYYQAKEAERKRKTERLLPMESNVSRALIRGSNFDVPFWIGPSLVALDLYGSSQGKRVEFSISPTDVPAEGILIGKKFIVNF